MAKQRPTPDLINRAAEALARPRASPRPARCAAEAWINEVYLTILGLLDKLVIDH